LWVAILIGFVLVSFYPGVAWQAHLGGIVYGAAVGFYFRQRERRGRY
jgi:membrane associated rhomboid family serine protease